MNLQLVLTLHARTVPSYFDKLYDAEVELSNLKLANTGHGHVYPRADGTRARCGGPMLCSECARDFVEKNQALL